MITAHTLYRSALAKLAVSAAILAVGAGTAFGTIAVDVAHSAVQKELKSRIRESVRVDFTNDREERLSEDDRRVSGRGFFTVSDSRDRTAFNYSVKVNRSSKRSWDLSLTFDRINDRRDDRLDDRRVPQSFRFEVRGPKGGERVFGPKVTFSGYGDGKQVRIDVYEGRDRKVAGNYFTIRDGRWEGTLNLRDGDYRAVARLAGSNKDITFSFTVRGGDKGRGPDRNDRRLSIELPRERDTVDGRRVEISGYSDSDEVRIRLYDKDDRRILDRTIRVRSGRWSITTDLREGGFHADVDAVGSRQTETVHFRVR
jgi:hypothetical protein